MHCFLLYVRYVLHAMHAMHAVYVMYVPIDVLYARSASVAIDVRG